MSRDQYVGKGEMFEKGEIMRIEEERVERTVNV